MKLTNIEWTDFSTNPLKYRDRRTGAVVWGCVKHSSGCANCYAEQIALRFNRGGPFTRAQMEHLEPFLDEKELRHILTAKTIGGQSVSGGRAFVSDMTDVFGEWVPDELLDRLFAVMALRKDVTFQILTKRPERMAEYLTRQMGPNGYEGERWCEDSPRSLCMLLLEAQRIRREMYDDPYLPSFPWPLPNVHLGTSVENQAAADERIPHLLATPVAVRFLSVEPLLGPVDLPFNNCNPCNPGDPSACLVNASGCGCRIDWVIVGGESGTGARPMQIEWARDLVRQCKATGVPVFVKQMGSAPEGLIDHITFKGSGTKKPNGFYRYLNDKKGGEPDEWPIDLRVREFPEVAAPLTERKPT